MAEKLITFDETTQSFHLKNKDISYVLAIEEGKILSHVYFGKRVKNYTGYFKCNM